MTPETITANDTVKTDSDALARLDAMGRELDHLDEQLHEALRILRALEPLLPLLPELAPRALAMLDPGAALRKHLPPFLRGAKTDG